MILVLDAGNTNLKFGLFEGDQLRNSWRMATKEHVTSDEIGIKNMSFLKYLGLEIKRETGLSKAAFKRAIGRLYKERKITLTDGKIRRA